MGVRSSQPRSPNLNKTDGHLLDYYRNTFLAGGGADSGPATALSGMTASGGNVTNIRIVGQYIGLMFSFQQILFK